jgi:CDP-diacylglycerol--glycerol-3-phosphate 3-phosphatidyltransferase
MPTIYDLKPRFQGLLRPLAGGLARAGVTANQVTIAAALLSVATGAAVWQWPASHHVLLLVPAMLFVRMALNAIDGMLAREWHQRSRLGAVLNELGDVVSDAALYLPFAVLPGLDPRLVVLAVLLAIIGELAGVVAIQIGATRRYDGPMGKSDRAFVFGLLALLLGLGVAPGIWSTALLGLVALLGAVTVVNRCRRALAESPA